ncbi:DUF4139 domain-containing protein [Sphingomonas sp. SUN039]|uniref:DUF4139 domain-containing protein n=1 Tax=Sphingomonas sp. SUN039 TaxID=2937787 RepID=UPI002164632A|nr:hypothetical protein [Sphingomonas sp. SUN039]UVO55957.1 hypothetical protein M0209_16155 [Sphingomonas sp. SUN039]
MRYAALLVLVSAPALAQTTTTSPAPETVSVSIYRAPDRSADEAMNLRYLRGFALVTETRRVTIPAGDGVIRFEGVAGGILPESAIVTGLPDGVVEKNQDANLLSPASLLGASVGRRVSIRRTVRATGKTSEEEAVIRSGPGGQVVLQTAAGIEALRCTGIPETIVYDALPEGLSAKPTLSVRTRSARAATATVTLSYLADNFDWQANYVATLGSDGKSLDLFGWVTLASADETSFPKAQAMVIAGRLNRSNERRERPYQNPAVNLTCWPQGTTNDISMERLERYAEERGDMLMPAPVAMSALAQDVVVTGRRAKSAMTVQQEELGDLKLYRVPEPVTVAANAQKQVALLDKERVPVALVYRADIWGDGDAQVRLTLRAKNRIADGLGLPLPAGKLALYQRGTTRELLLGEGSVGDKAVGEEVEIDVATATGVIARQTDGKLTVTNDNPYPVAFEGKLGDRNLSGFSARVRKKDGAWLWAATVPANGSVSLGYREKD